MILEKFNPVIPLEEDGFSIDPANTLTAKKNELLRHYIRVFTGTMERKYNYLVFLDLYSGSSLKKSDTGRIYSGSPALALERPGLFSKYIFCEKEKNLYDALRIRMNKYYRRENIVLFNDEPNRLTEKLSYYIPESSRNYNVSTLCLVDPDSLDIDFETIRSLSAMGLNFLFLFGLPWTKTDQFKTCINEQREELNLFLGEPWSTYEKDLKITSNELFFQNLVKIYHRNLRDLGYMAQGTFHKMENSGYAIKSIFSGYYSHTNTDRKPANNVQRKVTPQVSLFE